MFRHRRHLPQQGITAHRLAYLAINRHHAHFRRARQHTNNYHLPTRSRASAILTPLPPCTRLRLIILIYIFGYIGRATCEDAHYCFMSFMPLDIDALTEMKLRRVTRG